MLNRPGRTRRQIVRAMIWNDIKRGRAAAIAIVLFVAAASMLVSLAAILIVHLSGALHTLMTQAETPHYMQMHAGEIDRQRLAAFAERHPNAAEHQVLEFLNIDGSRIILGGQSLTHSVQDNGFSTQSERFDYLLDLDGKRIQVSDGELYVPLSYRRNGEIEVGGQAVISGMPLKIAGFVRDSQMNASLSSSKRFLVSRNDYAALVGSGNVEYLIEFRLKDPSAIGEFETDYASEGLEANGPSVTYPLFRLVNALSDGLMIAVVLLAGLFVTAIAILCIRFTLLAKLEDEYREIGVLKAIGIRVKDMKRIYSAKYAALTAAGGILGYALSMIGQGMLLANIRLYMGESGDAAYAPLLGIAGILLVCFAVIAYVHRVLRRFHHLSAAEAIRFGTAQGSAAGAARPSLHTNRLFSLNALLGIRDVWARKRLYLTMLAVLVLACFILVVPQNMFHTISSDRFIRYMGIGSYDLRIDIQQTDRMADKAGEIMAALESDAAIAKYAALTTRSFPLRTAAGSHENLKVELGDHSLFPVAYTEGRAPVTESELALSTLNADELGKSTGDRITLQIDGKERILTVSGIYSDITNGGRTAKAVFDGGPADIMRMVVIAELTDPSLAGHKATEYGGRFGYAKVSDVDAFVNQTFGSTIHAVGKASKVAVVVALLIAALVTILSMNLLIAKDRYAIAVLRAIGFTRSDVRVQYVTRAIVVLTAGIAAGMLLANTVGERLAGAVMSALGSTVFQFTVNPLSAYVLSPLMMTGAVLIAAMIGTSRAGRLPISIYLKE